MMLEKLQLLLNDSKLEYLETVQSLWSGYGEVARCYSHALAKDIIVKHIAPPLNVSHPRGWNTLTSHNRKLKSYQVESNFYRQFAHECDASARVPSLVNNFFVENEQFLILEDLDDSGYFVRRDEATMADMKLGIRWLANFHAKFLNVKATGLWDIGCYWHLATREDEYQQMANGSLKDMAVNIDGRLNDAKYKTLVHGDAKLANFCFYHDGSDIAGVDFQYVGAGVGVKDLAYFLGSCLTSAQLYQFNDELVAEYFSLLKPAIEQFQASICSQAVCNEWRLLYPFAWADFNRFLLGWSPEHIKINEYMAEQTQLALINL
ncbi:choline kinase [Colwelliaceae bacterium BS250]